MFVVVSEFKFEIEMTFSVPTFATEAIRLVVRLERFEIVPTFSVPTFATEAIRLETVSIVETFRVPTFARVAKTLVVTKRDVTLTTFMFDVP